MKFQNRRGFSVLSSVALALLLSGSSCERSGAPKTVTIREPAPPTGLKNGALSCSKAPIALEKNELLISILGTNDIHGTIAPKKNRKGEDVGGMAFWAGAVKAVRDGLSKQFGNRAGVLVLDGGDQFQGSLLSNYSEGSLMFSLMNEVGYDAIVPGNHDYDFGPEGWLVDQVLPGQSGDPRGVLKKLIGQAQFAVLSANTYLKDSIQAADGKPIQVESAGCSSKELIDWSKAKRPDFLKPYVLKTVAGIRVAIIGLDNPTTASTTTAANVSDLCFRTTADEYKQIRTELEGQADLFVLTIHDGDINEDKNLTKLMETLQSWRGDAVDAVIAGHTHSINRVERQGVFGIQSASYGDAFGRIDLVVDANTKKVIRSKSRAAAGASLLRYACDPKVDAFCEAHPAQRLAYECEEVLETQNALQLISDAEKEIAPMVGKLLGTAPAAIKKDRDNESPLMNFLTDTYRKASGADIAMINTGGVRVDIQPGPFTYEQMFQISPFNNRAVILAPMKVSTLLKILDWSARSCGKHGAVLFSGIRVEYRRGDCKNQVDGLDPTGGVDLVTMNGSILYDARDPKKIQLNERDLRVATLDFLEAGGSGYIFFKEAPREKDLGIFREILVDELAKNPGTITATIDGRFKNTFVPATP